MKLKYSLNYEDELTHKKFMDIHTWKNFNPKHFLIIFAFIMSYGILSFFDGKYDRLVISSVLFIIAAAYYIIQSRSPKKKYYELFEEVKKKYADIKNITIQAEDDYLLLTSDSDTAIFKYTQIIRIYEIKNYYYIKHKSNRYIILPKLKIDKKDLDCFIDMVKNKESKISVKKIDWDGK